MLILCKRWLTRLCHFGRGGGGQKNPKTAECSYFSFQGANAPRCASYHYIQIRRVEAVGSLPALNLLAKSVFLRIVCLFVHAYGLSRVPECLLKVSAVCASQNPCLYLE